MSFWKRVAHLLSHDPALEEAKAARRRAEAALASLVDAENASWASLVSQTLVHQGEPTSHVARLLDLLRRRESTGWDEASFDVEDERVRVWFVGDEALVPRAALIAWLERAEAQLAIR